MSGQTRRSLLAQASASRRSPRARPKLRIHAPTAPRTERRDLYPHGVASGDPAATTASSSGPAARPMPAQAVAPPDGRSRERRSLRATSSRAAMSKSAPPQTGPAASSRPACKPAREYWYRFVDEAGNTSRVGPHAHRANSYTDDRPVRFAFASCQDPSPTAR
jgi:alkaline phosphatase D